VPVLKLPATTLKFVLVHTQFSVFQIPGCQIADPIPVLPVSIMLEN